MFNSLIIQFLVIKANKWCNFYFMAMTALQNGPSCITGAQSLLK
jgi:hypothetical protein